MSRTESTSAVTPVTPIPSPPSLRDDDHEVPKCLRGNGCCGLVVGILIVWFLLVGGSVYGAIRFFHKLGFADFKAPPGTLLYDSKHEFDYNNYNSQGQTWKFSEYLLIQTKPRGISLLDLEHSLLFAGLSEALLLKVKPGSTNWAIPNVRGYWLANNDAVVNWNRESLLGGINNDTTVIVINFQYGSTKELRPRLEEALHSEEVTKLLPADKYTIQLAGIGDLEHALHSTVLENMGHIDAVAVSTGILIFAVAVRTALVWWIPLVIIISTIVPTLALGAILKQHMTVTGFAPEIMGSMVIALSIDFSLFFLARVRDCQADEANFGRYTPAGVIWFTYWKVSHNIAVSAVAIALAFGGLALIDSDFVRSIALVCCFGALVVLLTSMTLLPALVWICFPSCCCCPMPMLLCLNGWPCFGSNNNKKNNNTDHDGDDDENGGGKKKEQIRSDGGGDGSSDDDRAAAAPLLTTTTNGDAKKKDDDGSDDGNDDDGDNSPETLKKRQDARAFEVALDSMWAKVADKSAHYWPLTITLVLALCSPFLYFLVAHFGYDTNFLSVGPHSIDAYWGYLDAQEIFGRNIDTPMSIYLQSKRKYSYSFPYQYAGSPYVYTQTYSGHMPVLSPEIWPVYEIILEAVQGMPDSNTIKSEGLEFNNLPNLWKGKKLTWEEHVDLVNQGNPETQDWGVNGSQALNSTKDALLFEGLDYMSYLKTFTGPAFNTYGFENSTSGGSPDQVYGNWSGCPSGMINFGMRTPTWGRKNTRYWNDLHAVLVAIRQRVHDLTEEDTTQEEGSSSSSQVTNRDQNKLNFGTESLFIGYMGPNGDMWYVLNRVMEQFKTEVIITVLMLFGAMLLLFRSFAISLISIFTMGLTVATTFGIVTFVTHADWFHGVWKELRHVDAYFWVIVVLAFSICCHLCPQPT